jgi:hypothetical protein
MSEIFVSYRTHDAEDVAVAIENDLSHRFGSEHVFRASKSIKPGELHPQALLRNARTCRILVAVIGPHWLDQSVEGRNRLQDPDDWVRREIVEAFEAGARVIPIIVGRPTPSLTAKQLPKALKPLAKCQSIRYDYQRSVECFDKLSRSIATWLPELARHGSTAEPHPPGPQASSGQSNQNIARDNSTVNGLIGQAGNVTYNQHGGIGQVNGGVSHTSIGRATGPVHTGSGNQYNSVPTGGPGDEAEDDDE